MLEGTPSSRKASPLPKAESQPLSTLSPGLDISQHFGLLELKGLCIFGAWPTDHCTLRAGTKDNHGPVAGMSDAQPIRLIKDLHLIKLYHRGVLHPRRSINGQICSTDLQGLFYHTWPAATTFRHPLQFHDAPPPTNNGTGSVVWNRNQVSPKDLRPISPLGDGRCLAGSTLLLGEGAIQDGTKPFETIRYVSVAGDSLTVT